ASASQIAFNGRPAGILGRIRITPMHLSRSTTYISGYCAVNANSGPCSDNQTGFLTEQYWTGYPDRVFGGYSPLTSPLSQCTRSGGKFLIPCHCLERVPTRS